MIAKSESNLLAAIQAIPQQGGGGRNWGARPPIDWSTRKCNTCGQMGHGWRKCPNGQGSSAGVSTQRSNNSKDVLVDISPLGGKPPSMVGREGCSASLISQMQVEPSTVGGEGWLVSPTPCVQAEEAQGTEAPSHSWKARLFETAQRSKEIASRLSYSTSQISSKQIESPVYKTSRGSCKSSVDSISMLDTKLVKTQYSSALWGPDDHV